VRQQVAARVGADAVVRVAEAEALLAHAGAHGDAGTGVVLRVRHQRTPMPRMIMGSISQCVWSFTMWSRSSAM